MSLPAPPTNWDIDRLNMERAEAVSAFGFTERQARFLVDVMVHSGVFVERQYRAFAGIAHGQKTHDFLQKLVERGYARPIQVGALHRGRLFHVGHKPLYAAIGDTDNRHRKASPVGRMIARLMILDAVLADGTLTWLGTERDKRAYFMRRLQDRLKPHEFPHLTLHSGDTSRVRYFHDKLPIGIQSDWTDHVFIYLVTSAIPVDFRLFVLRHAELLRSLTRWTLRILVPPHLIGAIRVFGHAAREELATPISPGAAEDLLWLLGERKRHPKASSSPDNERFERLSSIYRTPRFRVLYRLWQQEGDRVIFAAQSATLKEALELKRGRVEFVQLAHQYFHLSSLVSVA